jgi:dTMP kinase
MFIAFEGIDGSGKSTQAAILAEWLKSQGKAVVTCRDPGSTALGESLRQILLDPATGAISRFSEMLIYMAARAQLVEEVIRPALASGDCVISDRFLLSNVVYQGHAGGLDVERIWEIGRFITGDLEPHVTFILDVAPAKAGGRLRRGLDRMESQGEAYQERLRAGYLAEARRNERIKVIPADRAIADIQTEIRGQVQAIW